MGSTKIDRRDAWDTARQDLRHLDANDPHFELNDVSDLLRVGQMSSVSDCELELSWSSHVDILHFLSIWYQARELHVQASLHDYYPLQSPVYAIFSEYAADHLSEEEAKAIIAWIGAHVAEAKVLFPAVHSPRVFDSGLPTEIVRRRQGISMPRSKLILVSPPLPERRKLKFLERLRSAASWTLVHLTRSWEGLAIITSKSLIAALANPIAFVAVCFEAARHLSGLGGDLTSGFHPAFSIESHGSEILYLGVP